MKKVLKKIRTFLIVFVCVVVALAVGVTAGLMMLDANKYRGQIVDVLGKQTGRDIKLSGPITLGATWHGLTLTIQDAAIGNPSWASRPDMAGIGHFQLGVAFLPLLHRQLSVTDLNIANADIQLESGPDDKPNWDMTATRAGGANGKSAEKSSGQAVAIHVDHISIKDSQVAIRDKNGKTSTFKTKEMTFGTEGDGLAIHFTGEYNGAPVTMIVKTGTNDLMSTAAWPFNAAVAYNNYQILAKGKASLAGKVASIDAYEVSAGKSAIQGQLAANWSGARTAMRGTILSDALDPADFRPAGPNASATPSGDVMPSGSRRVFSDAPSPLDDLKPIDAIFDVKIGELTFGAASLTQVTAKLDLNAGRLSIAPFKARVGNSEVGGQIRLDGSVTPAQLNFVFSAPNIDLADLLHLGGAEAFLSGRADAEASLSSSGNSMHALASNANGKISVIASGGNILQGAAGDISSGLMQLFAPGGSSNALNCLAARFIVINGVVRDNGILVDTMATTVQGNGGFSLGFESIDMTLHAKTKLVNVGSLLPPLHVGGTFSDPSFHVDPNAIVQNIAGMLTSGSLNNGVPNVEGQAGQNACVAALDHPQVQTTSQQAPIIPGVMGGMQQLKNIGGDLMKGLLGQ